MELSFYVPSVNIRFKATFEFVFVVVDLLIRYSTARENSSRSVGLPSRTFSTVCLPLVA